MLSQAVHNSTSIPTDIFALVILFIIFFAYAMYMGKSRIVSLLLAFYPAQLFYNSFPFLDKLIFLKGDNLLLLNKCLIFLLFLIPLDIIIGRYIFSDSGYGGSAHYFRVAGYAVAAVIMVLIFSHSIINIDALYDFSPSIDVLFVGADKLFYWNLAPFVVLFAL